MLRRILAPAMVVVLALAACGQSSANDGFAYSGFPFGLGFYQPYGIRYSTSVRTPPYFALNPPVYYGQRHYRPYGASPFASLPLVQAGSGYQTRAAGERSLPSLSVPHPSAATINPFCVKEAANSEAPKIVNIQTVEVPASIERTNPFAGSQVAKGQSIEVRTVSADR